MSGITFSGIYDTFRLKRGETDQHLRDKGDGLYLHKGLSDSSTRRSDKRQDGAQRVWNAIEAEYGAEIRGSVVRSIRQGIGDDRDPEMELFRSDLDGIKREIDRIENRRLQTEVFCLDEVQARGEIAGPLEARETLNGMFNRALADDEIRGLAGIPDRCKVTLALENLNIHDHIDPDLGTKGVTISIAGDPHFHEIKMTVYRDVGGRVHVRQDSITVNPNTIPRVTNLGACMLVRQSLTAQRLDVTSIHNVSIGGEGFNGYYTWARCGGNTPLLPRTNVAFLELPGQGPRLQPGRTNLWEPDRENYEAFLEALDDPLKGFAGIRRYEKEHEGFFFGLGKAQFVEEIGQFSGRDELDVQDLMQTESGRALWRVFGFTVPLTYDFGSDNGRRTFEQYTLPNSCFSPPETQ